MARKKAPAGGGAPEWLVTFADLMSLLVCFFVLIISFSIQDKKKLQIVAGSMRDAFGVKEESRQNGVIEFEGIPSREFMKDVSLVENELDTDFASETHDRLRRQGPEANSHNITETDIEISRRFATAAASLRQALRASPEIAELSSHVMIEVTPEGLNIALVDQDGRSMFAEGSKYPHQHTRRLLAAITPSLVALPNAVRISGHTTAGGGLLDAGYTGWELSADRANAARQVLAEFGLPAGRIHSVVGKAEADPLFPNDPYLAANRRVEILLISAAPPVPSDHAP